MDNQHPLLSPFSRALEVSWDLHQRYFKKLVFMILSHIGLLIIPGIFLLLAYALFVFGMMSFETLSETMVVPGVATIFGLVAFGLPLLIILGTSVHIGTIRAISSWFSGQGLSTGEIIKGGFRGFFPVVGASILVGFAVLVGLFFFIFPGIYLGIRFSFVTFYIVTKNQSVFEAMNSSWNITQGNAWEVFWRFFLLQLIGGIVNNIPFVGIWYGYYVTTVQYTIFMDLSGDSSSTVSQEEYKETLVPEIGSEHSFEESVSAPESSEKTSSVHTPPTL